MASPPINPYAPPKAVDVAPVEWVFGDLDVGRTVNEAWESCRRHFPLWLGVVMVAMVLMIGSLLTIVGAFVIVPVFIWGCSKFLLNMIDGRPSFDDLFVGFKNYLTALGRMLLLTVVSAVLGLLSESLVFVGQYLGSVPLIAFGYVVYLAFALGVLLRLSFGIFLVVDRDMGALEALGVSWRMTQGKTWKVIGLGFLSNMIAAVGLFACGVGIVWSGTMAWVMYASAYRQMIGPPVRSPAPAAW
jgi:uncharacterized membrane protein